MTKRLPQDLQPLPNENHGSAPEFAVPNCYAEVRRLLHPLFTYIDYDVRHQDIKKKHNKEPLGPISGCAVLINVAFDGEVQNVYLPVNCVESKSRANTYAFCSVAAWVGARP